MTRFFQSNYTGEIYSEYEILNAARIFRILENDTFRDFTEVFPSVIDFLKMNKFVKAVQRYRDIHNTSLSVAHSMVKLIEKDMKRLQKGMDK